MWVGVLVYKGESQEAGEGQEARWFLSLIREVVLWGIPFFSLRP